MARFGGDDPDGPCFVYQNPFLKCAWSEYSGANAKAF